METITLESVTDKTEKEVVITKGIGEMIVVTEILPTSAIITVNRSEKGKLLV